MLNFELLWFMIIAHCLADMCWQSSFISHNKNRKFVLMFFHALCVTGMISIPLYVFNVLTFATILFLLISHIMVDVWKSNQPKDDDHFWCIYVDQTLHLLCMILVVCIL